MKILHTADWHIGQSFFEHDRKKEHQSFLIWLRKQIQKHNIDALLIAGDIFDSPNPSAESQRLYYSFLKEVTAENQQLQIVIIAGNHDSAARLEAPNPLLETMNITVVGTIKRTTEGEIDYCQLTTELKQNGKPAILCLAVPYLRQGDYPAAETYAQGVKQMYETLYNHAKKQKLPIIAMGHLQATGAEVSDNDRSERTVIGGLDSISPDTFPEEIVYTALGHLHKAQRVAGRETIRYAGAPLPMSFAEKYYKQGVNIITIGGTVAIERLLWDTPVKLMSIPPTPMPLNEVLEEIATLPNGKISSSSPYLEIKVLITEPEPSLRHQIEEALKEKAVRLTRITATTPNKQATERGITYEELQTINPMDIAVDIFQKRFGTDNMPEKMKSLLQSIIQEIDK